MDKLADKDLDKLRCSQLVPNAPSLDEQCSKVVCLIIFFATRYAVQIEDNGVVGFGVIIFYQSIDYLHIIRPQVLVPDSELLVMFCALLDVIVQEYKLQLPWKGHGNSDIVVYLYNLDCVSVSQLIVVNIGGQIQPPEEVAQL